MTSRITLTLLALAFVGAAAGAGAACGGQSIASNGSTDAGVDASPYAAECAGSETPPLSLVCTGLYSDIAAKQVAPGVRAYAPAVPLWADTAEKDRWIWLPPGTKIDASNPSEWIFPVGTKVWKQFSRDGKRVETRLFQKTQPSYWVRTTYAWSADETSATSSGGGDMPWGSDGGIYHIPTPDE
jgi:hypothetical protein